jgi:hypothetical protein
MQTNKINLRGENKMTNNEFKVKMVEVQELYSKRMREAKTDEERFNVLQQQNKHIETLLNALNEKE